MTHTHRAQTTLDFAIAMGVFLLTVAFVFTFIPSLTAPFIDGHQEQTAIADRVSSHLVEGSLADPNEPYALDETCTRGFFEPHNDPAIDHCGYTNSTDNYRARIGVSDRPHLNISIVAIDGATRDRTPLCQNVSTDSVVPRDSDDCNPVANNDVVFQTGPPGTAVDSMTVARRIASIGDYDATVFVRVW